MSIYNFGTTPVKVDIKISRYDIVCDIFLFSGSNWEKAVSIVNTDTGYDSLEGELIDIDSLRRRLEYNAIEMISGAARSQGESKAGETHGYFSEYRIREWLKESFEEMVFIKMAENSTNTS